MKKIAQTWWYGEAWEAWGERRASRDLQVHRKYVRYRLAWGFLRGCCGFARCFSLYSLYQSTVSLHTTYTLYASYVRGCIHPYIHIFIYISYHIVLCICLSVYHTLVISISTPTMHTHSDIHIIYFLLFSMIWIMIWRYIFNIPDIYKNMHSMYNAYCGIT